MKCPRCGAESDDAYCSNCGAELKSARACKRCGSTLPAGARYCVQCGARAGRSDALRWLLPAAIAVGALSLGYWLGLGAAQQPDVVGAPLARSADLPATSPPPLTGSLRDQADRLFERIMQARARGDTAEAAFFLPMALQAYEGSAPLDADGLFHVGLLQLGAGRTDQALATSERIEALDPDHLFGIALAAEAALDRGDTAAARTAYAEFLAHFDAELARTLPEYEMHRPALDEYRERAREATAE